MPAPPLSAPTQVIEPGTHATWCRRPRPGDLIDICTLPLEPAPTQPRHVAVVGVGTCLGSEFDGREITDPHRALPGAVLLTYAPANPPAPRPGLVTVTVLISLARQRQPDPVAVWPGLDHSWPEICRTSVLYAARHHTRSTR
ncbi:MAG TPA: hypothetical protein VGX23_18650 [Actinocrinis sp.]|nr:hypothetical protein [Actinocrinis sp.]